MEHGIKAHWLLLAAAIATMLCLSGCLGSGVNLGSSVGNTHNEWTWVNGANVVNQLGVYGTRGIASPNNIPGARSGALSWTDPAGDLWLFGGSGSDSTGAGGEFNDLWKYSAGEWTWMSGSNMVGQVGVYGKLGVASPSNLPPARAGAVGWSDAPGNLWLFGGFTISAACPSACFLNDLWKYSGGEWTWMSGANVGNEAGIYGTQGIASPNNVPGARAYTVSWTDSAGNLWLFGGNGSLGPDGAVFLNDLWRYSAGEWTWVSGSSAAWSWGDYGTQGTASPNNVPGARDGAVGWTDAAGNFWLFGGFGSFNFNNNQGLINDLWKYSAGEWTWIDGANVSGGDNFDQPGIYGTQGTASPNNVPGARYGAVGWNDAAGSLWLFGGNGAGSSGAGGELNDLWKYSAGEWTWMSGSNVGNEAGIYGTQGIASPSNIPGARFEAVSWTDASGNFWLFGGSGFDSTGTSGNLNDLWKYQP